MTTLRRRLTVLAIAATATAGVLAPPTSARETAVHAVVAHDGSTVVSGYDGGVALPSSSRP